MKVKPQTARISSKITPHRVAVGRRHDITADPAKSLTYAGQGIRTSFRQFVPGILTLFVQPVYVSAERKLQSTPAVQTICEARSDR
jgi:hypothetical protein